jgi:Protein of unknown function (DUF3037)
MTDGLKQCDFFVLRYAPSAANDEFVNVGVILRERETGAARFAMAPDWNRVRCVDPAADVETLGEILRSVEQELVRDREFVLKKIEDSFSNLLQVSATKACLTDDPAREIETLKRMYLEGPQRVRGVRESSARAKIVGRMREEFTRAGVWELMWKRVPASEYTRKGDPLRIDCGYKPNGVVKLFHGVSLASDSDVAKVLAFSYPQLREGFAKQLKADAKLTAIVDSVDALDDEAKFAREVLTKAEIGIAQVGEMPGIAQQARVELKL